MTRNPTDKYKHFNHHHELTDKYEIVDYGDGEFIANKEAIPLLKALNELGLRTRTHHIDKDGGFFSILIQDGIEVSIRKVFERDSDRTKYNGMTELLISFNREEHE